MSENNITIYMDLDGTLTDVSERYYGIFSHYIQNYGFHIMSDAYMDLRRSGFSDSMIKKKKYKINTPGDEFIGFKKNLLESREWLEKDSVIGEPRILKRYDAKFVLITQRNNKEEALYQIRKLKLDKLFEEVVILKPVINRNCKYDYLKERACRQDYIIGDSPVELECARCLGINGCFVKTGLYGENIVKKEKIFKDYIECVQLIFKEGIYD